MTTVAELQRIGVKVESYRGPRLRVTRAWMLSLLVIVTGTAAVFARARARGRDLSSWAPALIYVGLAMFVLVVIVRQVLRLRDIGRSDLTLLGWGFGTGKPIRALTGRGSRGWRSSIGSPVVGVFVSTRGTLFVLVDQHGVGLVEADGRRFTAAIWHRDNRSWLLLSDGRASIALRIFQSTIS